MEFESFRGTWSLMFLLYKGVDGCMRTGNAWLRITSFLNVVVAMSTVSRYETSIELIGALTHDVHPTVVLLSVSLARTHVSDRQTVGHGSWWSIFSKTN